MNKYSVQKTFTYEVEAENIVQVKEQMSKDTIPFGAVSQKEHDRDAIQMRIKKIGKPTITIKRTNGGK